MIADDTNEMQRIAERNKKIEKLLAEGDTKAAAPGAVEAMTEPSRQQPTLSPPLAAWEGIVNGRRVQVRQMTRVEREAVEEKALMDSQRRQDEEFAEKVRKAKIEAAREQADMDKRREHEKRTNRRPYNEGRFISLAEAAKRGLIGQGSSDDNGGMPEWYSPKNPTGLMGGG